MEGGSSTPIAIGGIIAAFLFGSIPFGYLIGRYFYGIDIRAKGSGNIGAMNALRTMGKFGAACVLLLDALKGFLPTYAVALAFRYDDDAAAVIALTGAMSVIGHCFSPWLRFKGGKGVATSFGVIFALNWEAGLCCIAGWIVGALLTGYSSVGSMLGNIVAPFALYLFTRNIAFALYGVFAALLIVYTHRENIARLRAGTESGIGFLRRKA